MPITNTDLFVMGTMATLAALLIATSTVRDDDNNNKEEETTYSRPGIIIEEVD